MVIHTAVNGLRDISNITIPWENAETVWEIPSNPYAIVRCDTEWDYGIEGWFLAHCLGTKDYDSFAKPHMVYSLRDAIGVPHATILCVRDGEYSPYGQCWDLGSWRTFKPEDETLRVLQVRGRTDDIAHPIFHAMVREWYTSHGGEIEVDIAMLVGYLRANGDSDVNYHFRYLLDESVNYFTYAHWNEGMRLRALLSGVSL